MPELLLLSTRGRERKCLSLACLPERQRRKEAFYRLHTGISGGGGVGGWIFSSIYLPFLHFYFYST